MDLPHCKPQEEPKPAQIQGQKTVAVFESRRAKMVSMKSVKLRELVLGRWRLNGKSPIFTSQVSHLQAGHFPELRLIIRGYK